MNTANFRRLAGVLVAALCLGPVAWAKPHLPDRIAAIRFEGNEITRPEVMLQEMVVAAGDRVNPKAIERSRQAVMNLGLFKSVSTELEPGIDGYDLVMTVQEKYFILPIPRLDAKIDGGYRYGLELRVDNLMGLNQRINVLYQHKDSGGEDSPMAREAVVKFAYPRVVGTRYRMDLLFSDQQEPASTDVDGEAVGWAELNTRTYGFQLSRWLIERGPSRGWRIGAGFLSEERSYGARRGVGDFVGGAARALILSADYLDIHEYRYRQEGVKFGYEAEFGLRALGSDYGYHRHRFYYVRYLPTPIGPYTSFNWRILLGLSDGYRFDGPAFALGGGDTLRGHEKDGAKGDVMWLLNAQYLHPLYGHPELRGVVFVDAGNVFTRLRDWEGDVKVGAGLGLRWRIQSLVDVTLNLDWSIDPATGNRVFYGSTSRTF